jgi:hypothetical protein
METLYGVILKELVVVLRCNCAPLSDQGRFPPRRTIFGSLDSLFKSPEHPPEGWSIRGFAVKAINIVSDAGREMGVSYGQDKWLSPPCHMVSGSLLIGRKPKSLREIRVNWTFDHYSFHHHVPPETRSGIPPFY